MYYQLTTGGNPINNAIMKVEKFFSANGDISCQVFGSQYQINAGGDSLPGANFRPIPVPRLPDMNLLEDAGRIDADSLGFDDCEDDNARIFNLDFRIWFVEIETSNADFKVYAFRHLDEALKFATEELYEICSEYDRSEN